MLCQHSKSLSSVLECIESIYAHSTENKHCWEELESAAECYSDNNLLTVIFATALSENVVKAYSKSLGIEEMQDIWQFYFTEVISCIQRFQRLVDDSASGLQTQDINLHSRYYAMRIISLRVANICLSFWQSIAENSTGVSSWHLKFIPDIFATVILHTTFVDDPLFSARRKGLVDGDFLWTPCIDDEALMLR